MKQSLAVVAVLGATFIGRHAFAAPAASYELVEIPYDANISAANDAGTLAGWRSDISGHVMPYVFRNGQWTVMAVRGESGDAQAINSRDVISGRDGWTAVKWKNGTDKRLAGLDYGNATGIANDGTMAVTTGRPVGGEEHRCIKWKDAEITALPGIDGGNCRTRAIDSTATYVVGQDYRSTGFYTAWISDGTLTRDLRALPGDSGSDVNGVNRHGHAAVYSGGKHAAFWNGKRLVDLGMRDANGSYPAAINDIDDVLMSGRDSRGHVLFVYSARHQTTTAIEPRIVNASGWSFDAGSPIVITTDGTIYGRGTFGFEQRQFKLVPLSF